MTGAARDTLRVGMDLVDVGEVAASLDHFGDRYVTRIYTDHEIACCRTSTGGFEGGGRSYAMDSLAARFAAGLGAPLFSIRTRVGALARRGRQGGGLCPGRLDG